MSEGHDIEAYEDKYLAMCELENQNKIIYNALELIDNTNVHLVAECLFKKDKELSQKLMFEIEAQFRFN